MTDRVPPLGEIQSRSLSEQVLDVLRDAILDGDFRPGQPLVETDIAARLGVSRAPLREAIRILSAEGLVESVPYHGTTVRALTKTDIEELYSLRGELEAFAIRRVIQQDAQQAASELREHMNAILQAAEAGDLHLVNEEDRDFHRTLIVLSDHSLLLSLWNVVGARVRLVMALLNRRNSDLKQVAYNHVPIIEAIEAGDEARAVQEIRQHIANTGALISEFWEVETENKNP